MRSNVAKDQTTFTLDEVLQVLENVGVDVSCGACAECAFTGSSFSSHTCKKEGE
mgnify:CR=1 FL=1